MLNNEENTFQIIEKIFIFFENQLNQNNLNFLNLILPLLKTILPLISSNDILFSRFITTSKNIFPLDLSFLYECINYLNNIEPITQFFQDSLYIIEKNEDKNWINIFLNKIFPIIIKFFEQITDWNDLSEETIQAKSLEKYLFRFLSKTIQFLNEELFKEILYLSNLFISNNNWEPDLSYEVILFLNEIINDFSNLLFNNYLNNLFTIISNENFSILNPKWRRILRQIFKLFNKLYILNSNLFIQQISNNLNNNNLLNQLILSLNENNELIFEEIFNILKKEF